MMKKNKLTKSLRIFFLAVIGVMLMNVGVAKASFGLNPPSVSNDSILRGTKYEQQIVLVRDEAKESIKTTATINLPGAEGWVSIDKGLSFTLPAGQKIVPIIVSINVPQNAELKNYKGNIYLNNSPETLKQGTVAIALGGKIDLDFTVVEKEVIDFDILSIKALDTKTDQNLAIVLKLRNKGNVAAAPSKIVIDLLDEGGKIVDTKTNINELDKVNVGTDGEVKAEFDIRNLKPGSYAANIKTYVGDNVINEGQIFLSILDKEAKIPGKEAAEKGAFKISKNIWYVLGLVLILIAAVALVLMNRKPGKK